MKKTGTKAQKLKMKNKRENGTRPRFLIFLTAWLVVLPVFSVMTLAKPLITVKAESNSKNILINGIPFTFKVPVKVKNGVHIVRLKKELFTALGVKYLEWGGGSKIFVQLSHERNALILEIQKGRKEIKVKSGGSYVKITPMPTLEYPHVFVPLEPLFELLGFSVSGAPQTIVQKTKPEKKKIAPVKETETATMPETPVTQIETQPETVVEPVTPEKAEVTASVETPQETQPEETVVSKIPEEAKPALSPSLPSKQEKFRLSFGYSLFAPEYVKFSNKGLEGRISYVLPKKPELMFSLSYAEHTWNSVYPATAQAAELKAALWTANMTYVIPAFHRSSSRPLNDVYVTGGYANISMTYEPNAAPGLASKKQNFSGTNMGVGAKFWKVFAAEYRFYILPKRTLGFRSLEASSAEQFTFSLMPLSF